MRFGSGHGLMNTNGLSILKLGIWANVVALLCGAICVCVSIGLNFMPGAEPSSLVKPYVPLTSTPTSTLVPTLTPDPSIPTVTPMPEIGNKFAAIGECEFIIRSTLKAPLTAVFSGSTADFVSAQEIKNISSNITTIHGTGAWVVIGQVDAQNTFGAMLRSEYYCVMNYDGDRMTVLDFGVK